MQLSTLEQVQQWVESLSHQQDGHLTNRPIILIEESKINFDIQKNRYYFVNPKEKIEYGLLVVVEHKKYLLLFMQIKFVVQHAKCLLAAHYPVDVKMLSLSQYQELYEFYSKGNNLYASDLALSS
jgi:hypothetical protein